VTAIENELPTYRAISTLAIVSLLLGLLSVFSFASLWFTIVGLAAVVLGVLADRKIRRLSDVLTGQKLARAGVALGLIFSLSAITFSTINEWWMKRQATQFARQFLQVLERGSFDDAVFYSVAPRLRQGRSPMQVIDEARQMGPPGSFETQFAGHLQVKNRLAAAPRARVQFVRIEKTAIEDLLPHVTVLAELSGPGVEDLPETQKYAMLDLRAADENARNWWVANLIYPYVPSSYFIPPKPVDDGHGHAHAH